MIACLCPGCGSKLSAQEDSAGRTMLCPACGAAVEVPAAAGTVPLAGPETPEPRIHTVEAHKLPPLDAPARLDRQSHYLICGDTDLAACWQNNGRGWMLHTDFGFISATLNPDQLPSQGNFKLVELKLKMTDAGLGLDDLAVYQLADRWALTNLDRNDDRILNAVVGRAGLGRAERRRPQGHPPDVHARGLGARAQSDGLPGQRRLPRARNAVSYEVAAQ